MGGQISKQEKSRRLHILSEIEADTRKRILNEEVQSGRVCEVLFETYRDGIATGHTEDFIEVKVASDKPLHAQILSILLCSTDGNSCFGKII
jgi:tRNA A37 methylthiotransferase MiaB